MIFGDILLGALFGDPTLAAALFRDTELRQVTVQDHANLQVAAVSVVVPRQGQTAQAVICPQLDGARSARLDWLMAVMDLVPGVLPTDQGHFVAYKPGHAPVDPAPVDPAILAEALPEIWAAQAAFSANQTRQRLAMILLRAASRVRARAEGGVAALPDAPKVAAERYPYSNYFGVIEQDIAFPRFDGSYSETVTRAAFVMGDAVTVLPYDPPRDRVLVIEQFRFGPWVRGQGNPWCFEAIAGRIDPGETPQEAARREAVEEAHLTLGRMHNAGQYYPSQGAVTEVLYSFIAEADLPDGCALPGGLADEAEDIRAHLWSFDQLMEAKRQGVLTNGPLLMSALWLELNRDRLQAGA